MNESTLTSESVYTNSKFKQRTISCFLIISTLIFLFIYHQAPSYRSSLILPPSIPNEIGQVTMQPCLSESPGIDCGFINVPKDYFDLSSGTSRIAFARKNAKIQPAKGSLFIDPGGPGVSGVEFLTQISDQLALLLGAQWNIIGFDPRGIGQTTPRVQCFPDLPTSQLFRANTVLEHGITVSSTSNLSSVSLQNELIEQYREFLVLQKTQTELCKTNMPGDELRYMGTATVVRDMDFMARVFDGEDAPINYFGVLYGSVLGTYLVNMLPDRVGYVNIDGVVDSESWSGELPHTWAHNWLHDAEKTYKIFLQSCARAGPLYCPLSNGIHEDWKEIEQRLEAFFDKLAISPLPAPFGTRPGYLTSGAARGILYAYLYSPIVWPIAAQSFSSAMLGNATALFNILLPNYSSITWKTDLATLAVDCLDAPPYEEGTYLSAEELADQDLKTLREVSIHFGASVKVMEPPPACYFWPVRPPERFVGPWNASLRIPMLITSNTADPVTPMSSGIKIHSFMPHSSILIVQDGPGHTSFSLPSLCKAKLTQQYFSGKLPKNGTVCSVDVSLFPNENEEQERLDSLPSEDRKLLKALVDVAKYVSVGGTN